MRREIIESINDIVSVIEGLESTNVTVILPENVILDSRWSKVKNIAALYSGYVMQPQTYIFQHILDVSFNIS